MSKTAYTGIGEISIRLIETQKTKRMLPTESSLPTNQPPDLSFQKRMMNSETPSHLQIKSRAALHSNNPRPSLPEGRLS